jgi:hypothetical protein
MEKILNNENIEKLYFHELEFPTESQNCL